MPLETNSKFQTSDRQNTQTNKNPNQKTDTIDKRIYTGNSQKKSKQPISMKSVQSPGRGNAN